MPPACPFVVIHISGSRLPICRCNPAGLSRGSFGFQLRHGRDSLPQSRGLVPLIEAHILNHPPEELSRRLTPDWHLPAWAGTWRETGRRKKRTGA